MWLLGTGPNRGGWFTGLDILETRWNEAASHTESQRIELQYGRSLEVRSAAVADGAIYILLQCCG